MKIRLLIIIFYLLLLLFVCNSKRYNKKKQLKNEIVVNNDTMQDVVLITIYDTYGSFIFENNSPQSYDYSTQQNVTILINDLLTISYIEQIPNQRNISIFMNNNKDPNYKNSIIKCLSDGTPLVLQLHHHN
jgi:hypothetical protein